MREENFFIEILTSYACSDVSPLLAALVKQF